MTSTEAAQVTTSPAVEDQEDAEKVFSKSILVSAIRCLITYIFVPFIAPLIGLASGVGPVLGITIGTVAIIANFVSIRRFWKADHRWKKPVTVLHLGVVVLLVILLVIDFGQL